MNLRTIHSLSSKKLALMAGILCLLLLSYAALAGPQANLFSLAWWTADNGGTTSLQSGEYSLGATAGQLDAASPLVSGAYTLQPGFWTGSSRVTKLYLPLVRR